MSKIILTGLGEIGPLKKEIEIDKKNKKDSEDNTNIKTYGYMKLTPKEQALLGFKVKEAIMLAFEDFEEDLDRVLSPKDRKKVLEFLKTWL